MLLLRSSFRLGARNRGFGAVAHYSKGGEVKTSNLRLGFNPQLYIHPPKQSGLGDEASRVLVSYFQDPDDGVSLGSIPLRAINRQAKIQESNNDEEFEMTSPKAILKPDEFTNSKDYLKILQSTIGKYVDKDPYFESFAGAEKGSRGPDGGFMHIFDLRHPPMTGRIAEVEDILGSIMVLKDGSIKPGTYQPNPGYRVCSTTGFTYLSDYLYDKVKQACKL